MTLLYGSISSSVPASILPAPKAKAYIVNGLTRGLAVIGGTTALPIGVTSGPTFSAASTNSPQYYFVSSVEVLSGGENYRWPPTVTIAGVSGAKATLLGDSVSTITITTSATTHTAAPSLSFSAGAQADSAAAAPILRGQVGGVQLAGSAFFSSAPGITFAATTGVTVLRPAAARGVITYSSLGATTGKAGGVIVTDPGLYEWNGTSLAAGDPAITATFSSSPVDGAATLTVDSAAVVASVTMTNAGTDYSSAPTVRILPAGPTKRGDGAICLADLKGTTSVSEIDVVAGGSGYDGRATVSLESDSAKAVAALAPRLSGKYLLGVRFVDQYGTPGNLCSLMEVDCKDKASSITWNLSGISLSDGTPNRLNGAATLELWRTSADQATTLYRVTKFTSAQLSALSGGVYADSLPDHMLIDNSRSGYAELPILTPEGYPYANRFGIPPSSMSVVTMHQDRAWYAVDSTGDEPNAIYFSAVDEPESVPPENQIVIQSAGRESDSVTGLMPMDGMLYVGQRRGLVRLATGNDPLTTASAVPVAQRGMLNDRCWDQFEGIAYIADSYGVYAFSGSSAEALSDPVSTFWTTPVIDPSKAQWFFLRVNASERVVRFYFAKASDAKPRSALCYSLLTKAWWLEEYSVNVTCGVRATNSNLVTEVLGARGAGSPSLVKSGGGVDIDNGYEVNYVLKTGNFPLNTEQARGVRLTYTPTATSAHMLMALYYNDSSSARKNAISTNLGTGVVTTANNTQATLDTRRERSPLGDATGFMQVKFSGRPDDHSVGADRTVAVEISGYFNEYYTPPVIHRLEIEGAG